MHGNFSRKGKTSLEMLRELYPHLTEEQIREVRERFDAYLSIVESVMEQIENDPDTRAKYEALKREYEALTAPKQTDIVRVVKY